MLNILIAGELHPAGLKIINQNSKYLVDYLFLMNSLKKI